MARSTPSPQSALEEAPLIESMRFGVYLPPFGPFGDPNVLVELAVRAEAAGWDGVFLWDHVLTDAMPIADPWTTLAAIAHATDDLLLGPMVTPPARRRPWVVARHASTVSRLSRGRLVVGTGVGVDESGDFSGFGEPADLATRSAMLTEGLEVMRAMWAGEALEHSGTHYQVNIAATEPEPHRIPLWMASSTHHPRASGVPRAATESFPTRRTTSSPPRKSPASARSCSAPVCPPPGRSTSPYAATPVPRGRRTRTWTSRDSPRPA